VAREATARLYDVDEDSVTFKRLNQTEKYDQGVVRFRARKGRLIDLDKLHESVWASRLAHSTRSGLVSLDVVVIGEAIRSGNGMRLKVSGSDAEFVLVKGPAKDQAKAFKELAAVAADEGQAVRLTGRIDNYKGRWPSLYTKPVAKPRRLLVTSFEKKVE
jgi:hypothetical protein